MNLMERERERHFIDLKVQGTNKGSKGTDIVRSPYESVDAMIGREGISSNYHNTLHVK